MEIKDNRIDAGKAFDWEKTSKEYAKYRDIYPDVSYDHFEMVEHEEYDLSVPFTKESWHGRMRACRGVGASLSDEKLVNWDKEHRELLDAIAPEQFEVLHYAALAVLRRK
ncbi:MAG: hypothetical protein K6C41_03540 [Lachnospiraceae bacterium]|nr:hypothetical protein [Lachnospiraceae bacterium]